MDFARAVTGAGCHYVDLADARDFVARLPELDLLARQHNVVALCGASSTPALSMAVVAALSEGWRRVDSVESIILPGGSAQMGLSVVQAILSYAGKPVRLLRHGRWGTAPGWGLMRREVIPGLGGWFVSLVETPDLDLVPEIYPSVRHAGFFAGVELSLMHLGLWVLSLPVRWGVVSSLRGLAPLLHPVANWLGRFGGERGGMIVRVSGADASGAPVEAQWSLIADAGDGPNIPALPALCAVHALLRGEVIPGARACVGKLGEIETQFRRFAIRTERQVTALEKLPLFARTSDGFAQMPLAVRAAHCPDPAGEFAGEVEIESGPNFLARFVARIAGFPVRNDKCQARVTIERRGNDEVWIRRFGRHQFQSTLSAGELPHHVHERFGPITICMWLETSASGFSLSILGWSIWGVPLPRALAPTTRAGASSDSEGRYRFDTLISWPPVGRLVHYRGWLVPVTVAR